MPGDNTKMTIELITRSRWKSSCALPSARVGERLALVCYEDPEMRADGTMERWKKKHSIIPSFHHSNVEDRMASNPIRLKAFDHALIDQAAADIVTTAEKTGRSLGPIPLPTNRSCGRCSAARTSTEEPEHFELKTHKRLIDISIRARRRWSR